MSAFNIGNQPSARSVTQQGTVPTTNLFTNTSGGRGNLFTQVKPTNTSRPPPTPADRVAIQGQLMKYPQHHDTEAGRRAHQGQQAEWMRSNGPGTRITEATPYPLRPGTAPINSGECFTCGFTWEEETAALAKAVEPYIQMSRLGEPYARAFSGKQGEQSTYNS